MENALNAYRRTDTMGKSQLDLIVQVYDGAVSAYTAAVESYEANDLQQGHEHLEHARRFVTHLYTTLDFERGGEIAERLGALYAFLINQTDLVQATKDLSVIHSNIKILKNIREGWVGIRDQVPGAGTPPDNAASGSRSTRA
ncbi:MAG TPA: flagellar export chaperone FliS [Acidobacteriota bacterium]|nr:flagellar export chaperone FliS [Acidobacteriota bacterium]